MISHSMEEIETYWKDRKSRSILTGISSIENLEAYKKKNPVSKIENLEA